MTSFTQLAGVKFGPPFSPVWSLIATLPQILALTFSYAFLIPAGEMSRVK
jgi:hypothetical protein